MASRNNGSDSGCFVLLLLVGGIVLAFNLLMNWWTARPFTPILSEVKQLCNNEISDPSTGAAYRSGPVLLVHANSGRVHSEFRGLDPAVRAKDAADVATVACLEESQVQAGRYTDGAAGYAIVWKVRLIDLKGERLLGIHRLRGNAPPRTKSGSGSRTGSAPKKALRDWLANLSVQTPSNPLPASSP